MIEHAGRRIVYYRPTPRRGAVVLAGARGASVLERAQHCGRSGRLAQRPQDRLHPAARGQARASYWLRSPSSPAPDKGQRYVPYIGTWLQGDGSELFKTVYNNFVYLPQDNAAVVGKNPLTNPDAFGRAIV